MFDSMPYKNPCRVTARRTGYRRKNTGQNTVQQKCRMTALHRNARRTAARQKNKHPCRKGAT